MTVSFEGKLVVAISSRALFDLEESHRVYMDAGVVAYARYQIERESEPLKEGVALPLVRKLLSLNADGETRVEVVLLSRNSGRLLAGILKKKGNFVIVGHLAPYILKTAGIDMVAVLRRSPARLEETLQERGYSREKINENVSAEILGITLDDSVKAFGKRKVAEFDTTGKDPEQTAADIVTTAQKKKPRRVGTVDWLAVVSEEEVQRLFAY